MIGSTAPSGGSGGAKSSNSKGESHRIYWQQWPPSAISSGVKPSRRDIITGSAAIRISPDGARAQDVTQLLCETLNLTQTKDDTKQEGRSSSSDKDNDPSSPRQESWDKVQDAWEQDCLVLVGTLYSLPLHHVRFEHERMDVQVQQEQTQKVTSENQPPQKLKGDTAAKDTTSPSTLAAVKSPARTPAISRSDPPFHVIKSLSTTDNPIQIRNAMIEHLKQILAQSTAAALVSPSNASKKATATSTIAPKLQWYFVPGKNHPSSPIPSYVDLDGYTTSMEDEEDVEEEMDSDGSNTNHHNNNSNDNSSTDQNSDAEHDFDPDDIIRQLPLSTKKCHEPLEGESNPLENEQQSTTETRSLSIKERIFNRERQHYYELSVCQSSLHHDFVSGFLLKQSMVDPHVWRKVHCVLTDDHLWFMSRVYTRPDTTLIDDNDQETTISNNKDDDEKADPGSKSEKQDADKAVANGNADSHSQTTSPSTTPPSFYSFAKHRRLELTRAMLRQPSKDKPMAPLFRTPFAFELVDSSGAVHRFRASNANVYKRWVSAVSSRIIQSYENSLFEHAQLIVRDETEARHKRLVAVAVAPLWEKQKASLETITKKSQDQHDNRMQKVTGDNPAVQVTMDSPTMTVLRFGMEVTAFREQCRHIQATLPALHPVFAMTKVTTEIVRSNSSGENDSDSSALPSIPTEGNIRIDLQTQALIKGAWDEAIRLGSRATKITVKLQMAASSDTNGGANHIGGTTAKMPRSLEIICQHLEYVITGSFRGNVPRTAAAQRKGRSENTRQFPPPTDMFDALLGELQVIAATSSRKRITAAASQPSSS